jgi:DNA-3-methyladenine glycosylase II
MNLVEAHTLPKRQTRAAERSAHERAGRIPAAPGFELWRSLAFLRGFSPMMGEQAVGERTLTKALVLRGQTIVTEVRQEDASLGYRLSSDRAIDPIAEAEVASRLAFFLSADEDMARFHRLAAEDPWFGPLAARLSGLHHVKFPSPFEAACWGAVNQRCHLGQARAMKEALCRRFGGAAWSRSAGGAELLAFPEPAALVDAGEAAIRAAMKHDRKATVVSAIARAFAAVDDPFLRTAPLGDVEAWLHGIRGVGPFTSAFVLFRGLGRFVRQPLSPKLTAAAERVYQRRLSTPDVEALSASYGAWSGHWALYLWASTFEGLASVATPR